jgi:hypothetical protein
MAAALGRSVLDDENDSHTSSNHTKSAKILISDLGVRQDFIKNREELHWIIWRSTEMSE